MKFVVVNHRTPLGPSRCLHCSQSLGVGYLRDVATQRPFCDYDCYRHYEASRLFMPWLPMVRAASEPATDHSFGLMTSLTAAAFWGYAMSLSAVSLSLLQTALGFPELMAQEVVLVRRPK